MPDKHKSDRWPRPDSRNSPPNTEQQAATNQAGVLVPESGDFYAGQFQLQHQLSIGLAPHTAGPVATAPAGNSSATGFVHS